VTLEVATDPEKKPIGVVALIVKSGETMLVNLNVAVIEWVSGPLMPVTVRR